MFTPYRFLAIWAFIIVTTTLLAQPDYSFQWANNIERLPPSYTLGDITAQQTDIYGNVYVAGYHRGMFDFAPGTTVYSPNNKGGEDFFIAKYDVYGNLVFAHLIGGLKDDSAWDIVLDEDNNIYVTGTFDGSVDFDPGPDSTVLTATSNFFYHTDAFVAKYDSVGNFVWVFQMNCHRSAIGSKLTIDPSGYLYFACIFTDSIDCDPGSGTKIIYASGWDVFIAKYTTNGNFQHVITVDKNDTSTIQVTDLRCDLSGNIYIAGLLVDSIDFVSGPGKATLYGNGYRDAYVAKYDSSGNYMDAVSFGGPRNDIIESMVLDSFGGIYVTGFFTDSCDFDPGTNTVKQTTINGYQNGFLAKYDANFNYLFVVPFNSSSASNAVSSAQVDTSVFVSGFYRGTIDFDAGPGVVSYTSGVNGSMYIAEYDLMGNYKSLLNLGGTDGASFRNLEVSKNGIITSSGLFSQTIDFDPGVNVYSMNAPAGLRHNFFVAKYANCALFPNINFTLKDTFACGYLPFSIGLEYDIATLGHTWQKLVSNVWTVVSDSAIIYFPSFAQGDTGTYRCIVADACGIDTTNSFVIDYKAPLSIPGVNPVHIGKCAGADLYFDASDSIVPGDSPTVYFWDRDGVHFSANTSISLQNLQPVDTGAYYYIVSDECLTDTLHLMVSLYSQPDVDVSPLNRTACEGDTVTFEAPNEPSNSYQWHDSNGIVSNNGVHTTTVVGSFFLTALSPNGCTDTSDWATISFDTLPTASIIVLGNDTIFCEGDTVTLLANGTGLYNWSNGDGNVDSITVYPVQTTSYILTVTDNNNCAATDSVSIEVAPALNVMIATFGDTLNANGYNSYQWLHNGNAVQGADSSSFIATQSGYYSVYVSDSNGCYATSMGIYLSVSSTTDVFYGTFEVFPNPSNGKALSISSSPNFTGGVVSIMGLEGKVLKVVSIKESSMALALDLDSGLYIYQVSKDGNILHRGKIVVAD